MFRLSIAGSGSILPKRAKAHSVRVQNSNILSAACHGFLGGKGERKTRSHSSEQNRRGKEKKTVFLSQLSTHIVNIKGSFRWLDFSLGLTPLIIIASKPLPNYMWLVDFDLCKRFKTVFIFDHRNLSVN